MDHDDVLSSLTSLQIPKNHATVGLSNLVASNRQYRSIFVNRRLPDTGWSDVEIQHLLFVLSTLDTNSDRPVSQCHNDRDEVGRWVGVGEREGRVYSSLVSARHFGMSHGIGRSGDITEPQPKAAGSSTMAKLALLLVLDAVRRGAGLDGRSAAAHGILLPLCTGMSMALVLSSIRDGLTDEEKQKRDVVLWSRIDQKSCFKAIMSAGLKCVVVPTKMSPDTDEVVTDLDAMEKAMKLHAGSVLAVITTTSCFAPRVSDQVDKVAKLCQKEEISHVVNNAYGLQCEQTCKIINRACVIGRVDAIVSSTDKNFLVPVGGAVVLSPNDLIIKSVGKVYAGRASSAPVMDLFITLLSMGLNGYKDLLTERKRLIPKFEQKFRDIAKKHGGRLLHCPRNTISFGITLDSLGLDSSDEQEKKTANSDITYFGSMLFTRCVSGTRVVPPGQIKEIAGHKFVGFGSSTEGYSHAYLTAACALGVSEAEINVFSIRLDKVFDSYFARKKKEESKKKKSDVQAD